MILNIKHIYAGAAMAAILLGLSGCGKDQPAAQLAPSVTGAAAAPAAPLDEVTLTAAQVQHAGLAFGRVKQAQLNTQVHANGELALPPQQQAAVTSYLKGVCTQVLVVQGQRVSAGQALAVVQTPELVLLQERYLASQAQLTLKQQELERQQTLATANAGMGKKLQEAQSAWQAEDAALRSLASQLKLYGIPLPDSKSTLAPACTLRSPIAGHIATVAVSTGSPVQPEVPLITLVDPSHMHAVLQVFEQDVLAVQPGQTIRFFVNQDPGKAYTGKVETVARNMDEQTRTVGVQVHITDPAITRLVPGMLVTAEIQTGPRQVNTLPEEALLRYQNALYAVRVLGRTPELRCQLVPVTSGVVQDGLAEVRFANADALNWEFVTMGAHQVLAQLRKGEAAE